MRLKSVSLKWFRGASDIVELPANGKSLVVYGQNGAGKSSFVDGVEYAVNGGRLEHLRHEYSGRHQERAIPNTHIPDNEQSEVRIRFQDDSELEISINRDGTHARTGADAIDIGEWEYRRVILRQAEVASFIHSTKGDKYSSLLPLFGLHHLDVTAENLRQLSRAIATEGELEGKTALLDRATEERTNTFLGKSDEDIELDVEALHTNYCPDSETEDPTERCEEIGAAIEVQLAELSDQNQLFVTLQEVSAINLADLVVDYRAASVELAKCAEPLVAEKIKILQSAEPFANELDADEEIECPACGQKVLGVEFKEHVINEQDRLDEVTATYMDRDAAIASIVDAVKVIKTTLTKQKVLDWCNEQKEDALKDQIEWIEAIDVENYRRPLGENDLKDILDNCTPIVDKANEDTKKAPPEATDIAKDKETTKSAELVFSSAEMKGEVARIEALIGFIDAAEQEVRVEIRDRSAEVIDEISNDIMDMWKCLHPGTPIDDVHLCMPDGDKAIDIGLTFYGKELDSPRLTLSEGYRNSLGLCIFLAMAKREGNLDKPLVLDDVVISLDRDHRGMVAQLLEEQFSDRQVILMTHDRVWYAELRHQLEDARWQYRMLLPFDDPPTGIRWSHKTSSFDDARALLAERPDAAGNDARKIMDAETALISEKLRIRLPYFRGTKNDIRTCSDFIGRLASAGISCLQVKDGKDYICHEAGLQILSEVETLLVSWANRGSHSNDVVRPEATKLLDKCEEALAVFRCASCDRNIWYSHIENSEAYRCDCGELRWRYGKEPSD